MPLTFTIPTVKELKDDCEQAVENRYNEVYALAEQAVAYMVQAVEKQILERGYFYCTTTTTWGSYDNERQERGGVDHNLFQYYLVRKKSLEATDRAIFDYVVRDKKTEPEENAGQYQKMRWAAYSAIYDVFGSTFDAYEKAGYVVERNKPIGYGSAGITIHLPKEE